MTQTLAEELCRNCFMLTSELTRDQQRLIDLQLAYVGKDATDADLLLPTEKGLKLMKSWLPNKTYAMMCNIKTVVEKK